jgi:hypothetical protein
MACAITSLFLFGMLGVVVAGLALRPREKATPPVQRDQATAPTSGHSAITSATPAPAKA